MYSYKCKLLSQLTDHVAQGLDKAVEALLIVVIEARYFNFTKQAGGGRYVSDDPRQPGWSHTFYGHVYWKRN